jgi:hypothetical protein
MTPARASLSDAFYWYERTNALYTSSEMGGAGYITKVAFYLNSVNSPAESTPIVIKMKNASGNSITAATYDDASLGATTVYAGNITDNMLVANSWITVDLPVAFNYTGTSLEVLIETNLASSAVEPYNGKEFRHSETPVNRCQYWEDDFVAPTDLGVLTDKRPNIQLTFQGSCSGTPNPGATLTTQDTACANEVFTLSMENIGTVPGMTYEWQSSDDDISYNPIAGATNATYTTSQTQTKYYQCKVTCSSNSAISDPVKVVLNPFYHCYCTSGATDESDTKIDEVSIGTLTSVSDPFTCETYTDYTSLPAPTLNPNQPYTLHIKNGSCSGDAYGAYAAAWIDFNHNSAFDLSELVYSYGPITELNSIPDYTFFIPVTAASGITGMRVVITEGDVSPASCGSYTFGETEDYLVNIPAVAACTGTPRSSYHIDKRYISVFK